MKTNKLQPTDVIKSITFDVTIEGITYKGISIEYDLEEEWELTWEDIHMEDNDSWCLAEVGENIFDFQIFGNDESLGMDAVLQMQGCLMERDEYTEEECYVHSDYWIYDECFSNVQVTTQNSETVTVKC
jgi:hypothetical protein